MFDGDFPRSSGPSPLLCREMAAKHRDLARTTKRTQIVPNTTKESQHKAVCPANKSASSLPTLPQKYSKI